MKYLILYFDAGVHRKQSIVTEKLGDELGIRTKLIIIKCARSQVQSLKTQINYLPTDAYNWYTRLVEQLLLSIKSIFV